MGMLSLYDWQPTSLKTLMRLDGMPELSSEHQVNALRSAMTGELGPDGMTSQDDRVADDIWKNTSGNDYYDNNPPDSFS